MKKSLKRFAKTRTKTDLAALLVFFLLAGLLITSALFTWVSEDECYYPAIAQRLTNGDRLFTDEWAFIQISAIFLVIPYRVFTAVTGGTNGLLLFLRGLFIAVDLTLYWVFYFRMREKKAAAVVAAGLFCAHPFAGVLALNYYNISLFAFATVCFILCTGKKEPSKLSLIFAGAALSCAVLCTPVSAAVYALFTLAVFAHSILKKRRGAPSEWDFVLNGRVWGWMSVGVAGCAVLFLLAVALTSGLSAAASSIPMFPRVNPYHTTLPELIGTKLRYLTMKFGVANAVLLPAAAAAAAALRITEKKKPCRPTVRFGFFLMAVAATVSCCVAFCVRADVLNEQGAYLRSGAFVAVFYTLACRFLCREKNRRADVFLIAALAASVPMDMTSNFTLLANGTLAYFPAAVYTVSLIKDFREELGNKGAQRGQEPRKSGRPAAKLPAIAACAALVCEIVFVTAQIGLSVLIDLAIAQPPVRAAAGPDRGLLENSMFAEIYESERLDLEAIRTEADGRLYVPLGSSFCYLCADLPVGNWTPLSKEGGAGDGAELYWETRPQNRPKYIYLESMQQDAASIKNEIAALRKLCSFETETGKAGILLRVTGWYDESANREAQR